MIIPSLPFLTEEKASAIAKMLNDEPDNTWTYVAVHKANGWVIEVYDGEGYPVGIL